MANDNQRIENVVIVAGPEQIPETVPATKMRFWNEDGSPFALKGVDNKARLDALEARIAALEAGAEPEDAPSKK
jgi:hypothetical protein